LIKYNEKLYIQTVTVIKCAASNLLTVVVQCCECSVAEEDMLKHMTSLRTQYTRCVRSGIAASTALARTPRQKWLVRELAFLKPHLKSRPLPSTYHRPLVRMPTDRTTATSVQNNLE